MDKEMQRIKHRTTAILQEHIKELESKIEENVYEVGEIERMAEQNRRERGEYEGRIEVSGLLLEPSIY